MFVLEDMTPHLDEAGVKAIELFFLLPQPLGLLFRSFLLKLVAGAPTQLAVVMFPFKASTMKTSVHWELDACCASIPTVLVWAIFPFRHYLSLLGVYFFGLSLSRLVLGPNWPAYFHECLVDEVFTSTLLVQLGLTALPAFVEILADLLCSGGFRFVLVTIGGALCPLCHVNVLFRYVCTNNDYILA
jgi:hypothetical protein